MRLSYTSIGLCGPPREQVIAKVKELGREAHVSCTVNEITAVFDKECETGGLPVLDNLAASLTRQLRCGGLAFMNRADDLLISSVFEDGQLVARHVWERTPSREIHGPASSNAAFAETLCSVLGLQMYQERLESYLDRMNAPEERQDPSTTAFFIHAGFAGMLGFGLSTTGYTYLAGGEADRHPAGPDGLVKV